MAAGSLRTARGKTLNLGELKLRQSRAIQKGNMKDTVEVQERPVRQANVRGYIPSMEGVVPPAVQAMKMRAPVQVEEEYEPSIADLTGVVIDNSDGKKEGQAGTPNVALDNIIGDLEKMRKQDAKGDAKGRPVK